MLYFLSKVQTSSPASPTQCQERTMAPPPTATTPTTAMATPTAAATTATTTHTPRQALQVPGSNPMRRGTALTLTHGTPLKYEFMSLLINGLRYLEIKNLYLGS